MIGGTRPPRQNMKPLDGNTMSTKPGTVSSGFSSLKLPAFEDDRTFCPMGCHS